MVPASESCKVAQSMAWSVTARDFGRELVESKHLSCFLCDSFYCVPFNKNLMQEFSVHLSFGTGTLRAKRQRNNYPSGPHRSFASTFCCLNAAPHLHTHTHLLIILVLDFVFASPSSNKLFQVGERVAKDATDIKFAPVRGDKGDARLEDTNLQPVDLTKLNLKMCKEWVIQHKLTNAHYQQHSQTNVNQMSGPLYPCNSAEEMFKQIIERVEDLQALSHRADRTDLT